MKHSYSPKKANVHALFDLKTRCNYLLEVGSQSCFDRNMKEFIKSRPHINRRELSELIDWPPERFLEWLRGHRLIPEEKSRLLADVLEEKKHEVKHADFTHFYDDEIGKYDLRLYAVRKMVEERHKLTVCYQCGDICDIVAGGMDGIRKVSKNIYRVVQRCGTCRSRAVNVSSNKRMAKDELYKFKLWAKNSCSNGFRKGYSKSSSTESLLRTSFESYKQYIESLFEDWMTLDNYGEWVLDHLIPVSWAESQEEVETLVHYKNTAPLCKRENTRKLNRYGIYKGERITREQFRKIYSPDMFT